ncbi:MAG: bifunctional 5,10-methylenetetrahydrofolate dehydrogenase/5,10-methenyltetrahydrofolate cyclohydrolase [Phycisphaerales bacterium]
MSATTAQIINGRSLAKKTRREIAETVTTLKAQGRRVSLDAVLADPEPDLFQGASPARTYAEKQRSTCEELGIEYRLHLLPENARYEDIAGRILLLNNDDEVTAIMLHLPVPAGIDPYRLQSLIDPDKDVEGVNPANIGNVVYGHSSLVPCTALASMRLVESTGVELRGATVVCVGASNIVGKPIAVLMMRQDATVVSCNKYTKELASLTSAADVLIVAVGRPGLITADMVKPGAVVIDVGINRVTDPDTGRTVTVGDVDFDGVAKVAGWISPVPGGVGPMTVAMLLRNTVDAASR